MKKALFIAAIAAGVVVVLACVTAFADSDYEKYQKHMKEYYKHLREADEEAAEGDWDDYREEMEKAQKEYCKAQEYRSRIEWYGGFPEPERRYFAEPPRYHEWDGHDSHRDYYYHRPPYYGDHCWPRKSPRFFIDLDLDF